MYVVELPKDWFSEMPCWLSVLILIFDITVLCIASCIIKKYLQKKR